MTWNSVYEFLAMDGYAPYVWGSYVVALAAIVIEIVLLLLRKRAVVGHIGWTVTDPTAPGSAGSAPNRPPDQHGGVEAQSP